MTSENSTDSPFASARLLPEGPAPQVVDTDEMQ